MSNGGLDEYLDYLARLYPGQFGQSTEQPDECAADSARQACACASAARQRQSQVQPPAELPVNPITSGTSFDASSQAGADLGSRHCKTWNATHGAGCRAKPQGLPFPDAEVAHTGTHCGPSANLPRFGEGNG
jgi:hypothetical protein